MSALYIARHTERDYMIILLTIIVLLIFAFFKLRIYDIRFNTFFKRGLDKIDDRFGVYFVTGRQR